MKKAIAVMGTMSSAGKSTISLLLIRYLFTKYHFDIVPFKGQNMSLNSKVTPQGEEIASAQYFQAFAAGQVPTALMNPILLKPGNPTESYLIVNGKPYGKVHSKNWVSAERKTLWNFVKNALTKLMNNHDYILIEGAGSPVEINLRSYDITNMKVVKEANADTILVADIDRGGSFAQIVGTMELLPPEERKYIKLFILNKFRGDESLLKEGLEYLYNRYHIPTVIIPCIYHNLPEEDSIKSLRYQNDLRNDITIGIVKVPHMSNNDDFDPLIGNVNLIYIENPHDIDKVDVIILPGSRKVVSDLKYLYEIGIANKLKKEVKQGKYVIGICGGFQMLGKYIHDPYGIESPPGTYQGLNIIDTETTLQKKKILKINEGYINPNIPDIGSIYVKGYEIHHGITNTDHYLIKLKDRKDGYYKDNVIGTYLHGIFGNPTFTENLLNMIRRKKGIPPRSFSYTDPIEEIDRIILKVEDRLNQITTLLNIK